MCLSIVALPETQGKKWKVIMGDIYGEVAVVASALIVDDLLDYALSPRDSITGSYKVKKTQNGLLFLELVKVKSTQKMDGSPIPPRVHPASPPPPPSWKPK